MSAPRRIHRHDYQPPAWLVDQVELVFELGEEESLVRSSLELRRNPAVPAEPLYLDGEALDLRALALDGGTLAADAYQRSGEGLTLHPAGDRACVAATVALRPQDNTALSGLYRSGGLFCTQCEAMGFRRITYFPDRPDVLARYRVTLIAEHERFPVLLANGNLIEEKDLGDGRHQAVWEDPHPKPCYLFAVVAGNLHRHGGDFVTAEGRRVNCEIWVEPENRDQCAHALASLQAAMRWDETVFGRCYDLDRYMIVAVNDFNMGAMENKGLNVFNAACVLASPQTATDADYERIEAIVAHEYFHNWTGNRVTCRDWFQLTLKEGLTVYRDQRFTADRTDPAVKRIDDAVALQSAQWPEDAGPMAHPIRPESYIAMDNFYTLTVYEKGAEVVRLYEMLLGRDGFRWGMDLYFQRHDGQAVTCEDFRAAMADANGVDLTPMAAWYDQPGTPELLVEEAWDAAAGSYRLRLSQRWPDLPHCRDNRPVPIPVRLGLLAADGSEIDLGQVSGLRRVDGVWQSDLIDASATLLVDGLRERPVVSLLRGFSAPVRLRFAQSDEDLALRLAHDADRFNRWQAGQELARRVLLSAIADDGALPEDATTAFVAAFGRVLADTTLDGAYAACTLTLPGEQILAQDCPVIDPERIHAVRTSLRRHCGAAHAAMLAARYHALADDGPVSLDHAAVARRRLRNACLALLVAGGDEAEVELAWNQYRTAATMTDALAALAVLCEVDHPRRAEALEDFLARWRHEALVVDKWFALQARSALSDPQAIAALSQHPLFTGGNPNRFRALWGGFAHGNPVGFHRADGAGYALIAEAVIVQQARNPQSAARLVSAFNQWRRYDTGRQALMQAALRRIRAVPGLAKDVGEIVERALGER